MVLNLIYVVLLVNTCILMDVDAATPSTEDCTALQTFDGELRGFADDIVKAAVSIKHAPEEATESVTNMQDAHHRMEFQVQEMKDEVSDMIESGRRSDPELIQAQAHVHKAEEMVATMPEAISQAQQNISELKSKIDSMTMSPDAVKQLLQEADPTAIEDMDFNIPTQEEQNQKIKEIIDAGKAVFEKLLADDAENLKQATDRLSTIQSNFNQLSQSSDYETLAKQIKDNLDQLKAFFPQCAEATASDTQAKYYVKTEL